jgi:hypothetical protein
MIALHLRMHTHDASSPRAHNAHDIGGMTTVPPHAHRHSSNDALRQGGQDPL